MKNCKKQQQNVSHNKALVLHQAQDQSLGLTPVAVLVLRCLVLTILVFLLGACLHTNQRPNLENMHVQKHITQLSTGGVRHLAQEGNTAAQYEMGYRYYYGIGVHENIARAKAWFFRSASRGNLAARDALNAIKAWQQDHSPEDAAVVYYTPRPAYLPPPKTNRAEFQHELAADTGDVQEVEAEYGPPPMHMESQLKLETQVLPRLSVQLTPLVSPPARDVPTDVLDGGA